MALMESHWERLAEAIARARDGRGWNQEELARRAGVSRSTIQNLEGSGSRQYKKLPTAAIAVEQALGWPPGSAKSILAGGDPPSTSAPTGDVPPRTLMTGIPRRVAEELSTGEAVETVVMDLSDDGRGMRLVVVLKADDAAKLDPEQYRKELELWTQAQRKLRGLPTSESQD